jgi:hypothetical protein
MCIMFSTFGVILDATLNINICTWEVLMLRVQPVCLHRSDNGHAPNRSTCVDRAQRHHGWLLNNRYVQSVVVALDYAAVEYTKSLISV